MIRSGALEALSRRLALNPGRAAALAQRAADSGALPKAAGRNIPELSARDLMRLLLAVTADRGLGNAAPTVLEFEELRTDDGIALGATLESIIRGDVSPAAYAHGGLIFRLRPAGATLIANDVRLTFGAAVPEGRAAKSVSVPGAVLAAVALELRGYSPTEADTEIDALIGDQLD